MTRQRVTFPPVVSAPISAAAAPVTGVPQAPGSPASTPMEEQQG